MKIITYAFVDEVGDDQQAEKDSHGHAGGVVEEDIATQNWRVCKQEQTAHCHCNLRKN